MQSLTKQLVNMKSMGRAMNMLRALGNLLWVAVTWTLLTISPAQAADEVVYFHVDALGSATAAFNENGDLCWRQNYTPYGGQTSDEDASPPDGCGLIGKDRGYTGHVQDESGLTYMQQRYYDASIGRFLSIDPMGVDADDPRTYNRYSYAANNPYKYIDPDGEAFFLVAIPLIKAAAVFIAKEAAVEAASQLTGGATDILSTRRMAKRGFVAAAKAFDPKNAQEVVTNIKKISPDGRIRNADGTFAKVGGPTAGKPVSSTRRKEVLARDRNPDGSWTCATCGQSTRNPSNIQIGHYKTPRSKGGDLSDGNLRCEGAACNLSQGAGTRPNFGRTCADRGSCGAPYGRTD